MVQCVKLYKHTKKQTTQLVVTSILASTTFHSSACRVIGFGTIARIGRRPAGGRLLGRTPSIVIFPCFQAPRFIHLAPASPVLNTTALISRSPLNYFIKEDEIGSVRSGQSIEVASSGGCTALGSLSYHSSAQRANTPAYDRTPSNIKYCMV